MSRSLYDVAVVGGGMAGLMAAHHAALVGANVVHLRNAAELGGLVANVGGIDGFPVARTIAGVELANSVAEANAALGIEAIDGEVAAVDASGPEKSLLAADSTWRAKQVVVATGARLKTLDVPGAVEFRGRGISQCAWCDGGLFRGQDVVVVGGGDSALQEALHLARFVSSVTVVTRDEQFRARAAYVAAAADNDIFQFRWRTVPIEILGDSAVKGIRLRDETGTVEDLACSGVFVFIGLAPTDPLRDLVDRDAEGFIRADAGLETRTPGIFVVGAVRSGFLGQLTSAVGEATVAGSAAARRALSS